jgi:hypothetical protein
VDRIREYSCSARAMRVIKFSGDVHAREVMEVVWQLGQGKFVRLAEIVFFAEARELRVDVPSQLVRLWCTGRLRMRCQETPGVETC